MKKVLHGALAGIGVGLTFHEVKKALDEMREVNDEAMRAGVSASYMQKLVTAFDQVGIVGLDMDTVAKAMQAMTKSTGAAGKAGFESTLASIAAIGDEQGRVAALADTFGKMGPKMAPLVRQGPDALREGLRAVMAAMPAVTDEAVAASAETSEALKLAGVECQTAWRQVIGNIGLWAQETFGGTVAGAITELVQNIKWCVEVGWAYFHAFGVNIGRVAEYFCEDWRSALAWVANGVKELWLANMKLQGQIIESSAKTMMGVVKRVSPIYKLISGMTGEDLGWKKWAEDAEGEISKVGKSGYEVLLNMIPRGNDKLKFEIPDMGEMLKQRREMIKTAQEGLEAKTKLATGSVIEEAAKEGVKAIKDAARNTYTEAGTYDALKLALANRTGGAFMGRVGGSSAQGGYEVGAGAQSGGLMSALVTVAKNIETKLNDMSLRMARLETV